MPEIGHRRWAIAEGYIPSGSVSQDHALVSHEACCLLNAGSKDAKVEITLYFTDREPVGPYKVALGAQRTLHIRFNDLKDPAPVPRDTSYASVIESNVPDRCAAHAPGLAAPQHFVAFDDRLRRGVDLPIGLLRASASR